MSLLSFQRVLIHLHVLLLSGLLLSCGADNSPPATACSTACSGHGWCIDRDGGIGCVCDEGYRASGTQCIADDDPCASVTCSGHGECQPVNDEVRCICDDGYNADGTSCTPVDPCNDVTCSGRGVCQVNDGEAQCSCDDGYKANGTKCVASTGACADVTCSGHGDCQVKDGEPECACDEGYGPDGLRCIPHVGSACAGITCSERGQCVESAGKARCDCDDGYVANGERCEPEKEVCSGVTCSQHGKCVVVDGAVQCTCDEGYEAVDDACIAKSGPCKDVACSDHGTCDTVDGRAACTCDSGYVAVGTSCVASNPCETVTCSGRGQCRAVEGLAVCDCEKGYRAVGAACVPDGALCAGVDCAPFDACTEGDNALYVNNASATSEAGTKEMPYRTIQAAIDAADEGSVIHVAQGTYGESLEVNDKEVHLCGGWSSDFTERVTARYRPLLEGSADRAVVTLADSRQSTLVGFAVRGGQVGVLVETTAWPPDIAASNPRISGNVIEANGELTGEDLPYGGIVSTGGYLTVTGNSIRENRGGKGSALLIRGIEASIRGNIIEANLGGSDHGGAVYAAAENVTFAGNYVASNETGRVVGWGWGGGMIIVGRASLHGNTWTDNYSPSHGGALFIDEGATAYISNDLFYANRCSLEGGDAFAVDGAWDGVVTNVFATHITVVDHDCPGSNAILVEANSRLVLENSILWNASTTTDIFFQESNCTVEVRYTDFRTSTGHGERDNVLVLGPGNINVDPLFADPSRRDYHLQSAAGRYDSVRQAWVMDPVTSPAIDGGDPALDFNLEPAPNGKRVDMGCYGATEQASLSPL